MSERTLFLAWKDREPPRQWFPVGRLDADTRGSEYRFRYTKGAARAREEVGFPLLMDFPELRGDYRASDLFPLFKNRIIAPGRPDRADYLENLYLPQDANPIDILSVNGGYRVTDPYEVFPKLVKNPDGSFTCRFFLHGWQQVNGLDRALDLIGRIKPGNTLHIAVELTNPETRLAVQVQTKDYQVIGWAPRYLIPDLTAGMATGKYTARAVRINPRPSPSQQRVLVIEFCGNWGPTYEPMASEDFLPLSP